MLVKVNWCPKFRKIEEKRVQEANIRDATKGQKESERGIIDNLWILLSILFKCFLVYYLSKILKLFLIEYNSFYLFAFNPLKLGHL